MVNIDIKKQLTKFFIYITGLPGSGKLSTAIVLSSMINALIVSGFEYNQTSKEVQNRIYNIVQVMLQAVEAYPIDSKNYIFLDDLMKNNNDNITIYNSIVELSKKMSTKILPIVLRCNPLILQERTILKKQRKNRKVTNINSIKFRAENLFVPPNAIEIENSNMSIKEVAEEIVSQMYKLGQINSVYAIGNDFIY
ncbi:MULTISPECIES: AAA family ATPase [unclassified Wolbachia]|uniref:AAA family ATPase n=1 Tax=unclassified Wolbachia TaxID=2640676 RepID=UPI002220848C|nr:MULTISPECIES: AAA family ATPase [unclassified Wolbachia]MEC4734572.1 AAA family ATPase [Wolbachia endosymbiont of Halictus tumulorum]WGJ62660.1 AAA family ATPase [Wolbachia endosymbiont of Frankliniella intonsa]